MPFADGSFDVVLANHVLEHVDDDRQAVAEIHRVLARGGRAILQTPYSRVLQQTWSDPGIVSEGARLQAYGQKIMSACSAATSSIASPARALCQTYQPMMSYCPMSMAARPASMRMSRSSCSASQSVTVSYHARKGGL